MSRGQLADHQHAGLMCWKWEEDVGRLKAKRLKAQAVLNTETVTLAHFVLCEPFLFYLFFWLIIRKILVSYISSRIDKIAAY